MKNVQLFIFEELHESLKDKLSFSDTIVLFKNNKDIDGKIDYLFSFGGDGTLLSTIPIIRESVIPIIGINTGRLGFLSSISKEEVDIAIDYILHKKYTLDKRTLLRLETDGNPFGEHNFALNDIAIHKRDSHSMILIHAYINNQFLNSYWADGIIISTPTGSTGYSLSCGGPILTPVCENFIITPIATHNLTVRPIVIRDNNVIKLKVSGRIDSFLIGLDSKSVTMNAHNQELIIKKESFTINLVHLENSFFDTIRNKLNWGKDIRL